MPADATRCSVLSAEAGEQLAGTAAVAPHGYLLIEDDGPWGPKGLTECSIERELAQQIDQGADAAGLSALLFRRFDSRRTTMSRREVIVARTSGARAMIRLSVDPPEELLDIDWTGVARAADLTTLHPSAAHVDEPVMLVCTHARRDRCCAIDGRAALEVLHPAYGDRVLECSHLGGHRFATTALVLPAGAVYGRLSPQTARDAIEAAAEDRLLVEPLRGLSRLSGPEQAADQAVRSRLGADDIDDVRITGSHQDRDETTIELAAGGSTWQARVRSTKQPPSLQSCAKPLKAAISHTVERLEQN